MTLSIAENSGFVLGFVYAWGKSEIELYSRHVGSTVQKLKLRGQVLHFPRGERKTKQKE